MLRRLVHPISGYDRRWRDARGNAPPGKGMYMANCCKLIGATLLTCLVASLLVAARPAMGQATVPEFEFDVVSALAEGSEGTTRLDIYTSIPFSHLQFVNAGEYFSANYDLSASLYRLSERDRRQDLVQTRSWRRSVTAPAFDLTRSGNTYDRAMHSLEVEPGRYLLELRIEDRATGQVFEQSRPVLARDLVKLVAVSDLILLDSFDEAKNAITPNVANTVGTDQDAFRVFYELYATAPQRVRLIREVIKLSQRGGLISMRSLFGLGDKDDEEAGEITYTKVEATPLKAGRNQAVVEIPTTDMKAGDYRVRVRVESESGELLDFAEKVFTVEWNGLDRYVQDIDAAIAQLKYIAKEKDLRYMSSGKTKEERLARFREFWAKRDPTPGTERNERMEEYYFRISYANNAFSNISEGWKTDRGHVSILFGEPDQIEQNTQSADNKSYEIWYYRRIGRRFVFIDRTGRGDFELLLPIWDEKTYIR
jgi:GWxTD domain-containing protein